MNGYIYIAGSFLNPFPAKCKTTADWIDNDPCIYNEPYTWGICRYDLRNKAKEGDYIFFVLPKKSNLRQMIFAYMKIGKMMTHEEAYKTLRLHKYRMVYGKNPNGNILVDAHGKHHPADHGRHKFRKIKDHYAVADMSNSRKFTRETIEQKALEFVNILHKIFNKKKGNRPIDLISRKGQQLNEAQVERLQKLLLM